MKKFFKVLSFVLALSLMCSTMAFAAEAEADSNATVGEAVPVTIVFEDDMTTASPRAVGSQAQYVIGASNPAVIEKAGLNPTFKYWATGAADCQITVEAHPPAGATYTQTGLPANGTAYIEKHYVYLVGGTWTFTAYVVSGNANGRTITLHIQQV